MISVNDVVLKSCDRLCTETLSQRLVELNIIAYNTDGLHSGYYKSGSETVYFRSNI